jgi:hypothetical protein
MGKKKVFRIKIKVRLPRIHLPKLPNPVDVVTDVAKGVGKAINDVVNLPKKVGAQLERDLKNIASGLDKARKDVEREAGGAINLITDAARAAAKFAERQAKSPLETIEGALHKRDVVSSIWHLATNPIKSTNKNAMQATRDSALLAAAAQVAATAYGGPAGAAAYATWTAYNASGGDINAALRAGVTTGLVAAATGAVAKMPVGPEKIAAEAALKGAIASAQGKKPEEAMQAALASLVQVASAQIAGHVDQAGLDKLQKGIVSGALGGAAVAASGGSGKDVQDAFLKSGGEVLVQGIRSKASDIADAAKESASAFLSQAIEPEDLKALQTEVDKAKSVLVEIDAKTKKEISGVVDATKKATEAAAAEIAKARALTQAQVDAARAQLIQARKDAESRIKLVQDEATKARDQIRANLEKDIAAGKGSAEALKAAADHELSNIKKKADAAAAGFEKELAEVSASVEPVVKEGLLRLEESRALAMNEMMGAGVGATSVALSNEWVLSWNPKKLTSEPGGVGVALTYAGRGSDIDRAVDAIESPPEPR